MQRIGGFRLQQDLIPPKSWPRGGNTLVTEIVSVPHHGNQGGVKGFAPGIPFSNCLLMPNT